MENKIQLKTVNMLSQYSFYIPAYQRGYRWTALEVKDLLDDIDEFVPKEIAGTNDKTWYCLQPLVVKKKDENLYEVIDGQQRLTTVYLILLYLNQDFMPAKRDKLFEIEYQTREKSKEFLQNPEQNGDENIDFFYIHNAYMTIEEWFDRKADDLRFDKDAYRSKLKFSTQVIWYETEENNPTQVFSRLNIGKISLTNAELIRALFLNSSNFKSEDERRTHLRQVEIANEWDNIESALQNDKFWYFLSNENKEDNRIEYIFNMMSDLSGEEAYSAFRYFNARLYNKTERDMRDEWEDVQSHYQRFREWFNDRELYHKIGFLLTARLADVKNLYEMSSTAKKSEFKEKLNEVIKRAYQKVKLSDLDYEDKNTRSVLLLYNILTMLQNEHDSSYFPFDDFKLNKWNIEHIASRKDASSVPEINRKDWLEDAVCYIDIDQPDGMALKRRADECLSKGTYKDGDTFQNLFNDITDHFNQYMNGDNDIDNISNLALLDEKTNKGYKNAVFPLKRKYIIDLDKSGGFVPLCTKNVFLKYFSDYPPKVSFWTSDDREKYEEDLKRVLGNYMEVGNDNE